MLPHANKDFCRKGGIQLHLSSARCWGCCLSPDESRKEEGKFLKLSVGKCWEYFWTVCDFVCFEDFFEFFFLNLHSLHSLLWIKISWSIWPNRRVCLLTIPDSKDSLPARLTLCLFQYLGEVCVHASPSNEQYRMPIVVDRRAVQFSVVLSNPCPTLSTKLSHCIVKAEDTIYVSWSYLIWVTYASVCPVL